MHSELSQSAFWCDKDFLIEYVIQLKLTNLIYSTTVKKKSIG